MNICKKRRKKLLPRIIHQTPSLFHAYVLPYRQLEGFMRGLSQHVYGLKLPDYTTIWWRISKMKADLASSVMLTRTLLSLRTQVTKVSNREEWIRRKWKVKRGFIKVHIAVDTKNQANPRH